MRHIVSTWIILILSETINIEFQRGPLHLDFLFQLLDTGLMLLNDLITFLKTIFKLILYETPVLCDGISAREVQHATSGRVNIPALPVPEGMVVGSWKGKVFLTRLERWQH